MGNKIDTSICKYIKLFYSTSNSNLINTGNNGSIQDKLTGYIKKHPSSLYSESDPSSLSCTDPNRSRGPRSEQSRSVGLTPYMYASLFNVDTLMMLHNIYENVMDYIPDVYIEPFEYKNKNGQNLIHFVVERIIKGKQELFMLEYIINNIGVDINSTDKHGNTVLHLASKYNKIDIVKVLLFYGADVHVINNSKKIAMSYAVINKNMEIFKLLLYKNSNYKYIRTEDNYPLFYDIIDTYKKKLHKKMVGISKKKSKNKSTERFKNQHIKLCSVFIHRENDNKKPIPEHYKKELRYLAKQLNIHIDSRDSPEQSRDEQTTVNESDDEYEIYNNLCKLISHKILMKKSLKK